MYQIKIMHKAKPCATQERPDAHKAHKAQTRGAQGLWVVQGYWPQILRTTPHAQGAQGANSTRTRRTDPAHNPRAQPLRTTLRTRGGGCVHNYFFLRYNTVVSCF